MPRRRRQKRNALLRARSGFDINQLAAEYRALWASVLRLWMDAYVPDHASRSDDLMRFNEAIDQALAESIGYFAKETEQSRNLLLGMLGHDMRSPLQTIQLTAMHLAELNAGAEVSSAAGILIRSGASMQALVDDLVDFNRVKFGMGLNITRAHVDLGEVFADKLKQVQAAYPQCRLEFEVKGDVRGFWDGRRLQQMLGNLVENAVKYGASNEPVRVTLEGRESDLLLCVHNLGAAIDPATLRHIFNPLTRGPEQPGKPDQGGLGLGLFIASEITKAHGGEINAQSDETETVFAVRLPRRQRLAA